MSIEAGTAGGDPTVAAASPPPGPLPAAEALAAADALAAAVQIREPSLHDGWLYWLEQRPAEQGRTTLLRRPAGDGAAQPQELTPAPRNLRSRLHGYGGGCYALAGAQLVTTEDTDGCLWWQQLHDVATARRLTPAAAPGRPRALADGLVDLRHDRWIGVLEEEGRDQLVAVSLQGGEPMRLHRSADFCGYPVLSPDGARLAWIEWQQPFMPWQRSQLWLARISADGTLQDARVIAGSDAGSPRAISVFQPLWAGDDLIVSNDRSGWWNLERLAAVSGLDPEATPEWQPLLTLQAEFAQPQWVAGLRTTAWDGHQLLAAACLEGRWQLGRCLPPSTPGEGIPWCWQPFALPFSAFEGLTADAGRLAAIASAPDRLSGLLELSCADGRWQHHPVADPPLPPERLSHPQALWFPGHGGLPTHAWFYPPASAGAGPAPLLVRGHSGPTGMAGSGLNPALQFWTSRGWGVVEVNYGGSSGFGRHYRERLDGQWGVVDVDDCLAAARALVADGRADRRRLAMEGGSAGGFTVLEALARDRTLAAGCCRYPVTDLCDLAAGGDHRFEARYCDSLVGPWPAARATYRQRSPLAHPERIQAPVIVFHGLADAVVPAAQSERMVAALRQLGRTVELHLIPDEGHGFRSRSVQIQVLEASEAFFRRQLNL